MGRSIAELVEQQLVRWRAQRQAPVRLISSVRPRPEAIAISREVGTEAGAIAIQVSELVHLPLYDHQILEHIAKTAHVHLETIQTLDERVQGRVEEYVSALLRERRLDRSDYLMLLARTVVSIWEHGPCVLMGHGSVQLVPREHALTVRLLADFTLRARQLSREQHLPPGEAERKLAHEDAEQAAFYRRFFHANVADPHHYDLTIDAGRLGVLGSARLIVEGYRQRFASRR